MIFAIFSHFLLQFHDFICTNLYRIEINYSLRMRKDKGMVTKG